MFRTGFDMTTAVTDLINAAAALIPICWLIKQGLAERRNRLWAAAYSLFALNSAVGFILHGFYLSDSLNIILWSILYVVLGLMLAMYVSSVRYDVFGEQGFDKFLRVSIIVSAVVCVIIAAINVIDYHYSFPLFSAYCILNIGIILSQLFRRIKEDKRFAWYLAAIMIFVIGSVIQAINTIQFSLIWDFNHDSVYHFAMLIFLLVQFKGIRLLSDRTTNA